MTNGTEGLEVGIGSEQLDDWLTVGDRTLQLIDVRRPDELADKGNIPGSRNIPLTEVPDQADSINWQQTVVFYCASGERSKFVAEAARGSGYEAHSLVGGFALWCEEGRPFTDDTA
jgi:rhodanese-related sulfurtransferase